MLSKIIILGGGGHAKMCIDILRQTNNYEIIGIIDNIKKNELIYGVPVVGNDDDLNYLFNSGIKFAVNGIGGGTSVINRYKIFQKLKNIGFNVPILIHKNSIVEGTAEINEGTQIMAGAIVGSDAKIDSNCIINSGAIVSHDCKIGTNVHIAPGAVLAGSVCVGDNSLIGMNSTIFFGKKIGSNVIITNGKNIYSDVSDNKIIKENISS